MQPWSPRRETWKWTSAVKTELFSHGPPCDTSLLRHVSGMGLVLIMFVFILRAPPDEDLQTSVRGCFGVETEAADLSQGLQSSSWFISSVWACFLCISDVFSELLVVLFNRFQTGALGEGVRRRGLLGHMRTCKQRTQCAARSVI